jgi:acyl carrier protein
MTIACTAPKGGASTKKLISYFPFTVMIAEQIDNRLHDLLVGMGINQTALTDHTNFSKDLGLDSLDITDLLLQVEINFGIRIPDQEWWKLETFGQLKEYLAQETQFD